MHFASSVEVITDEKNELFNAVSIYVPSSLAAANIVDFDPAWVSTETPAVFTCVLDNYKEIMKGRLLDQWQDVFRQDTNPSAILYLIVFQDGSVTDGLWEIDDVSIKFKPLTDAFNALRFISYFKTLFDETYDGKGSGTDVIPPYSTAKSVQLRFQNTGGVRRVVSAGDYTLWDHVRSRQWEFTVDEDIELEPGDDAYRQIIFVTLYIPNNLNTDGVSNTGLLYAPYVGPDPGIPVNVEIVSVTDIDIAHGGPSKFFDLSLALAYMCKIDLKLSYFVNMVKVSYADKKPDPEDECLIRGATAAEEKANMLSVKDGDRSKYYWGALFLMNCVRNTWTLVHSEPVNIIPLILAAWFAARNGSGQFVGNKLSLLRLRGPRIKPLGFPSWLNSEVNENDAGGFDLLDEKNVGYLCTISDNTPQESCVSSGRSADGTPVAALMISKYVDYTSSQQCARLLTDSATLTNPVLTNEAAYARIKAIVFGNLRSFTPTGRVTNIRLKFPPFTQAKVSARELAATGSWEASYVDDLDEITITGGITAA